jgi:hypothetical protein
MNIFFLNRNIRKCAEYHCDKHVVKMTLESVQILSSAAQLNGMNAPYKITHPNHPSVLWAQKSLNNWMFLWFLSAALNDEYKYRFRGIDIKYFNPINKANFKDINLTDDIVDSKKDFINLVCDIGNNLVEKIDFTQIHEIQSIIQHFKSNRIWNHKSFDTAIDMIDLFFSSQNKIDEFISSFDNLDFFDPPQAMPIECKKNNPIDGYKIFYIKEKYSFAKWTKRNHPEWMVR